MAATAEQRKLTGTLLETVEATRFPREVDLERIERLISTRDELVTYIAILTEKVQGTIAPYGPTLVRLERLLVLLQRIDQDAGAS